MKFLDPSLKLRTAPDGSKWVSLVVQRQGCASCRWYIYDPDGGFIATGFAISYGEGHTRALRALKRRWEATA
jgi:hypothetical protein